MKKISYVWKAFAVVLMLVTAYSCEREDGEPQLDSKQFSRLYVSFEEYGTSNAGIPDTNVRIINAADSNVFKFSLRHLSPARGGGVIYFNPYLQSVFHAPAYQSGLNDSSVYSLSVGPNVGLLTNTGRMGNRLFDFVKGFAYHAPTQTLLMVNADGPNAGIYFVDRPKGRNNYTKPFKKLRATGLDMWGAAFYKYDLFVSKRGENGGIYVFEKIMDTKVNAADSIGKLEPTRMLSIADAKNLRGLAYDTLKNVLAVTDYVTNGAVGTGRILIFDNFSSLIKQETIVPTRIITGAATLLKEPVDVAIDSREKGVYIYVVDKSKKILRFKLSDDGNIAPDNYIDTGTDGASGIKGTPVSLTLDARDFSTLNP